MGKRFFPPIFRESDVLKLKGNVTFAKEFLRRYEEKITGN